MVKVEEIEGSFVDKDVSGRELVFTRISVHPFSLTGFYWFGEDGKFLRLLERSLPDMNEGVRYHSTHTSGGMVRFKANSSVIAIKAELTEPATMTHMPASGSAGFDLYIGSGVSKKFFRNVKPENNSTTIDAVLYEKAIDAAEEFTLYFPLYNGVKELFVGFAPGSVIEKPSEFAISKPIVFYGSSITQGACASRPGNAYTHFLTRWLDANLVNLGFSGSAKGEREMGELISKIDMSVFVYDYDHNAPDPEYLRQTHKPFFEIIRRGNPNLPIIIVSRPDYDKDPRDSDVRRDIVYKTYSDAINAGDNKVFFVDGERLFGSDNRDACTVDTCHPNDIGFYRMARTILPVIDRALGS